MHYLTEGLAWFLLSAGTFYIYFAIFFPTFSKYLRGRWFRIFRASQTATTLCAVFGIILSLVTLDIIPIAYQSTAMLIGVGLVLAGGVYDIVKRASET